MSKFEELCLTICGEKCIIVPELEIFVGILSLPWQYPGQNQNGGMNVDKRIISALLALVTWSERGRT